MKLRNKKTGEICELGHIRQAWREEKDGGMGYMFLKADDNNGIIYNSLAEMMDEWEDYKPVEPLIKDEKIRKAVQAWAEVNSIEEVLYAVRTDGRLCALTDMGNYDFSIEFVGWIPTLKDGEAYTIAELCGEEQTDDSAT